jgi:hypothetical protein
VENEREQKMKMNDIKEIARQRGINPAKLKKSELIRAIQQDEGNPVCFTTGYKAECGQLDCLWREDCDCAKGCQ